MEPKKHKDVDAGDPRTYAPENLPTREGGQARSRGEAPSHAAMKERRGASPAKPEDG